MRKKLIWSGGIVAALVVLFFVVVPAEKVSREITECTKGCDTTGPWSAWGMEFTVVGYRSGLGIL